MVGDLEQLADLAQPQPGPLGTLDQPQPANRSLVIEPVAGRGAGGLGEQADAFVVADGVGAEAGLIGQGGNGEGHTGRVNLGVHSKVKRARAASVRPLLWLGVLEDDAFDGVGDMGQLVQGLLDAVGNVLPAQHVLGRVFGGEVVQLGADPPMQLVAFVLQVIDGGQVGVEAVGVELVQAAHALAGLLGRPQQDPGLLGHRVQGLGDAVRKTMSPTSSMASVTLSSRSASSKMSSRSKRAMKVEASRVRMVRVRRSPSCSSSASCLALVSGSARSVSRSTRTVAAARMVSAAAWNSPK